MPRVDFYILPDAGTDARQRFVCRLAEKAYDSGQRVFVRTVSSAESQQLDELLWSFNDRSFIPHEIATATAPTHSRIAVLIGEHAPPPQFTQLLINLVGEVPTDLDSCERIAEIVDADPQRKQQARDRFRQYRERGCTLETHELGKS